MQHYKFAIKLISLIVLAAIILSYVVFREDWDAVDPRFYVRLLLLVVAVAFPVVAFLNSFRGALELFVKVRTLVGEKAAKRALRNEYLKSMYSLYGEYLLSGLSPQLLGAGQDLAFTELYLKLPVSVHVNGTTESEKEEGSSETIEQDTTLQMATVLGQEVPEEDSDAADDSPELLDQPLEEMAGNRSSIQKEVSVWDAVARGPLLIIGEAGSGKTTILHYLALALSGETEYKPDNRLKGWLPIVGRLSEFAQQLESEPRLATFLSRHPSNPKFDPFLEEQIDTGNCLILLDGLDEVGDPVTIFHCILKFMAAFGDKNRIVVTTRPHTAHQIPVRQRFVEARLQPLADEQVSKFIKKWYAARSTVALRESRRISGGPEALKKDLERNEKPAELARNPLMLTILILYYWQTGRLPSRPIDLYEYVTDTLLDYWPKYHQRISVEDLDLDQARRVLMPVAYQTIAGNKLIEESEVRMIFAEEIVRTSPWDKEIANQKAKTWIDLIAKHTGILVNRRPNRPESGLFEFPHQRLAEYLAGRYLVEMWQAKGSGDVFDRHLYKSKWEDVLLIFIAQLSHESRSNATKALEQVLTRTDKADRILRRHYLFAGRALGEDISIEGDLSEQILETLFSMLVESQDVLRSQTVDVLAGLRGTKYQKPASRMILALAKSELPWKIALDVAKVAFSLGEKERSQELVNRLRDDAHNRGSSTNMQKTIDFLLEHWGHDTCNWLLDLAQDYAGRGLHLVISDSPSETTVSAADESFRTVPIGGHLSEDELERFIGKLLEITTPIDEQNKAQWVLGQLSQFRASAVRNFAENGTPARVRRLAAQWLVEHDSKPVGLRVLMLLVDQGDGNLRAVQALSQMGQNMEAVQGSWITLTQTLSGQREQAATRQLSQLGEKIPAATIMIELLLAKKLEFREGYEIAKDLLKTPAHDVGLAALKKIAASLDHPFRLKAALAWAQEEVTDMTYDILIDIADRWEAYDADRVSAVLELKKPPYEARLLRDNVDLRHLAETVLTEINEKISGLTEFLEADIIQPPLGDSNSSRRRLSIDADDWARREDNAWREFCEAAQAWLRQHRDEISLKARPYMGAALGYLKNEDGRIDEAAAILRKTAAHSEASVQLLFRIADKLENLLPEAREDVLQAIPQRSHDKIKACLALALYLQDSDSDVEKDLALAVIEKVLSGTDDYNDRRLAALLLFKSGTPEEEWKTRLMDKITREIPQRKEWLRPYQLIGYDKVLLLFTEHLLEIDPEYVYASVNQAEMERSVDKPLQALERLESAVVLDEHYDWAWGVMANTLVNLNRYMESLECLDKALKLNPAYRWAWFYQARLKCDIGRDRQALDSIDRALSFYRHDEIGWLQKGKILEYTGDWDGAIEAYNRARRLSPSNATAQIRKAEILRRMGQFEDALQTVEQGLSNARADSAGWVVKTEILACMNRYDDAFDELQLALGDDDVMVRISAISALRETGDVRVIPPLSEALLNDDAPAVHKSAAFALGVVGRSEAIPSLIEALAEHDKSEVRIQVITAFLNLNTIDTRAKEPLFSALEKEQDEESRRRILWALGRVAHDNDGSVVKKLAEALVNETKHVAEGAAGGLSEIPSDTTLDVLQRAVKKRPDLGMIHSRLGVLLRKFGRFDEALAAHNMAINQEERDLFYFSRALTHVNRQDFESASRDLRRAIELDPYWTTPWSFLGVVLLSTNQEKEAIHPMWRSKSLGQGEAFVLAGLSVALWRTGNQMEAKRLWQLSVSRQPRFMDDWDWTLQEIGWSPRMVEITKAMVEQMHDG